MNREKRKDAIINVFDKEADYDPIEKLYIVKEDDLDNIVDKAIEKMCESDGGHNYIDISEFDHDNDEEYIIKRVCKYCGHELPF